METLSAEQLADIAMNPLDYGYLLFALTDTAQLTEDELRQFTLSAILCLLVSNGQLRGQLLSGNATEEGQFYIDVVNQLGGSQIFPEDKADAIPSDPKAIARAMGISEQTGIPVANMSFLENHHSGDMLILLSVIPGVNPQAILQTIAHIEQKNPPTKKKRLLN